VIVDAPGGRAGDAVLGERLVVFERVAEEEKRPPRGIKVDLIRGVSPVGEPVEAWVSMHDACSMEVFEVTLETRDVKILSPSRFEMKGGERVRIFFTREVEGAGAVRVTTRRIKDCNGVRD